MISNVASSHPSFTSRPRPHRLVALALTTALACALPACLIGEPEQSELTGRQVRTTFVIEPTPEQPAREIFLILDPMDEVARTFAGTLTVAAGDRANLTEVSGTLDERGELSLDAEGAGSASRDELRIAVRDQDDDGVYESGAGHMSGFYSSTYAEIHALDLDFRAAPDAFTPPPGLGRGRYRDPRPERRRPSPAP